ncbi:magnesium transporter [Actinobacteria bacterium YIM 96077]|uniref:Magnesium transporter MgtE n=1 Tax=Phytoactinopolyspora halophila TaxID=1981511 RepID=A0A329QIC7_9ACTN|nr:magnesium transporter [Phytoactinopolyspora halophila]AYY14456.1 magnesium transporter [Actinobacteria bacterium YIM 96077]RAW11449.1 magnesium transporter [Phytoactinopolyspora halophila]
MTADLLDMLKEQDLPYLKDWLNSKQPYEIANELLHADAAGMALVFRLLDKGKALAVFEELDPSDQQEILAGLRDRAFRELVEGMDPDDRARLIGETPAKVARRVLAGLSPHERQMTAALLGYPEGSAGRAMTPEVVALHRSLTAAEALNVVRTKGANAETVYTLPVVDDGRRLVGITSLRDLVTAPTDRRVNDIATMDFVSARATDEAEDAARLMRDANLLDLPIVDSEDRLLGLLTIDDAVEVLEEAETEDAYRQSGSEPLAGSYLLAGIWMLATRRVPWLMLLFVAAILTINVLDHFEENLAEVTALALFIPMITGSGGNTGAQSATSVVRALALAEVRVRDVPRVLWTEARVGALLGLALGLVGIVIGLVFADLQLALVIAISLLAVCTWAAIVGGCMPLFAKKLGIDPAVVSAPMVATLVDATGLIIYFMTARTILGL